MSKFQPGDVVEVIDTDDINCGFVGIVKPWESSRVLLETRPALSAHAKSPSHDVFGEEQLRLIKQDKLKIGDKVRIIGPRLSGTGAFGHFKDDLAALGEVGCIENGKTQFAIWGRGSSPSANYYGIYPPESLQLVTEDESPQPAKKLKEGGWVRLLPRKSPYCPPLKAGEVYQVKEVEHSESIELWEPGRKDYWYVNDSDSWEVVDDPKYSMGDTTVSSATSNLLTAESLARTVDELTRLNISLGDWGSSKFDFFPPINKRSYSGDNNNKNKKGIIMSLTNKVKELALSKEVRLRRKHNVENACGERTQDGTELLLDLLYAANLPEIDKKLAEIEAAEKKEAKK